MDRKYLYGLLLFIFLVIASVPTVLADDAFRILVLNDGNQVQKPQATLYCVVWDQIGVGVNSNNTMGDYALMGGVDGSFWEWSPVGNLTHDHTADLNTALGSLVEDVVDIEVVGPGTKALVDHNMYAFVTKDEATNAGSSGIFNQSISEFEINAADVEDIEWEKIASNGSAFDNFEDRSDMVLVGKKVNGANDQDGKVYYWNAQAEAGKVVWENLDDDNLLLDNGPGKYNWPSTVIFNDTVVGDDQQWYVYVWNTSLARTDVYNWTKGNDVADNKIQYLHSLNDIRISSANYTGGQGGRTFCVGYNNTTGVGLTLLHDPVNTQFINITNNDAGYDASRELYAVKWHPDMDPGEALCVGNDNSSSGDWGVYKYSYSHNTNIVQISGNGGSEILYDLAWEPQKKEFALIVGVDGIVLQYHLSTAAEDTHEIQGNIDNVAPEIDGIYLNNSAGSSVINGQLDVATTYYLTFTLKDENGWEDIGEDGYVLVNFWYDNGDDSKNFTGNPVTGKNYKCQIRINDFGDKYYPKGTDVEVVDGNIVINSAGTSIIEYNLQYQFYINFTLGKWIKQADDPVKPGQGGVFGYNDLNSWNVEIVAYDGAISGLQHNNTTGEAVEFGVYKYASLSIQNGVNWVFPTVQPGTNVDTDAGGIEPTLSFISNDDFDLRFWFSEDFSDGSGHSMSVDTVKMYEGDATNAGAGTAFGGLGMSKQVKFISSGSLGDHSDNYPDKDGPDQDFSPSFKYTIPIPAYAGTYSAPLIVALIQIN